MNKPDKPITNVLDLVSGIVDQDFVDELDSVLRQGAILRSLIAKRVAEGVSQAEIAEKLNCSQSRVSKLERGRDGDLKLEELAAYGNAIGREFEIIGHHKGSTPVDRVKSYVFAIHRELQFLAELAKDDQKISKGVSNFFGEAFFNVVNLMNDAAKSLPDRPLITMQMDADECGDEASAEKALPVRKRATRKRNDEAVPV
ncbi:MAG: transcriptional regulator [Planctomycetota bacterium]|nr:transcriptional regulator [Planctomycetota bacterium]